MFRRIANIFSMYPNLTHAQQKELQQALSEFMGALEVVFRYDWEYTTQMIDRDTPSFFEPGVEDETEDWGSRGAFLEKYRNLVSVMKRYGLSPTFPFPLENLPGSPERVW